jgi:hypothetical protein
MSRAHWVLAGTLTFVCLFAGAPARAIPDLSSGPAPRAIRADFGELAHGSARNLIAIRAEVEDGFERRSPNGQAKGHDREGRRPHPGQATPLPRVPREGGRTAIPEPASTLLIALGSLIVGKALRRKL